MLIDEFSLVFVGTSRWTCTGYFHFVYAVIAQIQSIDVRAITRSLVDVTKSANDEYVFLASRWICIECGCVEVDRREDVDGISTWD